jgi:Cu/Ag efflux pump CusA
MERANGQGELRRENLRPMAVVSGRLEGRDLGGAVADIRTVWRLKLPSATPTRSAAVPVAGQAFRSC